MKPNMFNWAAKKKMFLNQENDFQGLSQINPQIIGIKFRFKWNTNVDMLRSKSGGGIVLGRPPSLKQKPNQTFLKDHW